MKRQVRGEARHPAGRRQPSGGGNPVAAAAVAVAARGGALRVGRTCCGVRLEQSSSVMTRRIVLYSYCNRPNTGALTCSAGGRSGILTRMYRPG